MESTSPLKSDGDVKARPGCAFLIRDISFWAFLILLAGYLTFNRSFAVLGLPPIYIGEMVLGLAVIAALTDFTTVFIEPIKRSRSMQLIGLFMFYCVVRICIDASQRGLEAARDGVVGLYAIAAFLAPWLFVNMHNTLRSREKYSSWMDDEVNAGSRIAQRMVGFLTFASAPAVVWGWGIYLGWIRAPADVKVDFLTLSAAVASTVYAGQLIYCFYVERAMLQVSQGAVRDATRFGRFILFFYVASTVLVLCLPTRAIQPGIVMVGLLPFAIAVIRPSSRKKALLIFAGLVIVCGMGASVVLARNRAVLERIEAVADTEDSHFQTREGQLAAHSGKWRVTFWKRCIDQTLSRAPVFGLGFGTNLTDLLRDTPAWPMFADSQNVAKYGSANRHPHSAHVGIFTRLGSVGLAMWLALLAAVLVQGWKNVWRFSDFLWSSSPLTTDDVKCRWNFVVENTIVSVWLIYVLAMSFGVVLENPFGGIWFWTLTGVIVNRKIDAKN